MCVHANGQGRNNLSGHGRSKGGMHQNLDNEVSQTCPNGDNCDKAHNRVEEFYHPDKYKAKFCSSYLEPIKNAECDY